MIVLQRERKAYTWVTRVQTHGLAVEINSDEVLVVKQMCLPSIQISFPNVDLD